ncbi:MAG TPA: phosphopantothenoylcysteine decarboxylase [Spirochaetota bacterium]|nr:phosphopantothenoylcysteine decarboxylase [Spirochaetota bacterium]HPC41736.1 phosphopantothenoylcysteine decarboxylase [Spirochaetota bacterium]HPL18747.1 phosphopantothenoylcysteine decarboxylase [Spirochaetota bacterium]HQF06665.1 phosphopantothenoylcysteine decarboxylase [Spirochaetota bacterium]HQH95932.1 phosphopantothenoylcysteine decarboxylase [Spirochaetota bacterium]
MQLSERKAIITGGPTREWLDPVRFISNPSTGKMGIAIADVCAGRARETVFIHGPIDPSLVGTKKYRCVGVESTRDMLNAVAGELCENAVLIMAAAPADYSPVSRADRKIKKSDENLVLELKKTPDILKEVAAMKRDGRIGAVFTVGFAAETDNLEEYAIRKLNEKNLDMICLNDVSQKGAGFGSDTNIITIFFRNGTRKDLPLISKREVAARIVDEIEARLPRYLITQ